MKWPSQRTCFDHCMKLIQAKANVFRPETFASLPASLSFRPKLLKLTGMEVPSPLLKMIEATSSRSVNKQKSCKQLMLAQIYSFSPNEPFNSQRSNQSTSSLHTSALQQTFSQPWRTTRRPTGAPGSRRRRTSPATRRRRSRRAPAAAPQWSPLSATSQTRHS